MWKVSDFIFLGSKITADGDCSLEIKRPLLLERIAMTNLSGILKSRDITLPTKGLYSQSYGFSSSHVWLWELDYKEGLAPKNWCFLTVVLKKTLQSPFCTSRRSNQSILKEVNPEYSWDALVLKHQYFGPLIGGADSLEKTLMLGKIEGRRRRGQQRMRWWNGITVSEDMSLSKLQEILNYREAWHAAWFMGLQRVRHDRATEQQQQFNVWSVIHFEEIFVRGVRSVSHFCFCMWLSSGFSTIFWKDFFSIVLPFLIQVKYQLTLYVWINFWALFHFIDLFFHRYQCFDYCNCMKVKVARSCPTLCDPMDCSLPGSSVHGII